MCVDFDVCVGTGEGAERECAGKSGGGLPEALPKAKAQSLRDCGDDLYTCKRRDNRYKKYTQLIVKDHGAGHGQPHIDVGPSGNQGNNNARQNTSPQLAARIDVRESASKHPA
jgi:hypothetical protein